MARREAGDVVEGLRALVRCIRAATTQTYATFEVGSTQAKFLRHIGEHSHISQAELARATDTDPALTGRVLETLVAREWVRRTRSKEDRRQYVLELAAAGQRARKRVDEARAQIAERIASVLNERDVDDFDRVSKKILAAFDSPPEKTGS